MSLAKKVAAMGTMNESWGPAIKESGFEILNTKNLEEALKTKADCFLLDARDPQRVKDLAVLKSKTSALILSLVKDSILKDELVQLQSKGAQGHISDKTPAEEIVVRLHAMLAEPQKAKQKESRAARRVWFQEEVEFNVFERSHKAWSTTLSETGIFLRTNLSFPLYSLIHLKFHLLGIGKFESDGVIVRQEVEGDIRGIGIMFQNLKGENVRSLESYLEIYK